MGTLCPHMRIILGLSSDRVEPLFLPRRWGSRAFGPQKCCQSAVLRYFSPTPTKNVSDDLSREDFGLSGLTNLKCCRKSLIKSS